MVLLHGSDGSSFIIPNVNDIKLIHEIRNNDGTFNCSRVYMNNLCEKPFIIEVSETPREIGEKLWKK